MEGTIRTFDRDVTARLMVRIGELAGKHGQSLPGSAVVEELASAPPLKNDPDLVNRMADWAGELLGKQSVYRLDQGGMGSEDFASYTYEVPSAYLLAGGRNGGGGPQVRQAHAQRLRGVQRGCSAKGGSPVCHGRPAGLAERK